MLYSSNSPAELLERFDVSKSGTLTVDEFARCISELDEEEAERKVNYFCRFDFIDATKSYLF